MKKENYFRFFLFMLMLFFIAGLSANLYLRKDMTKGKIYTLSDYTVSLLQSLDSAVEITWFKSQNADVFISSLQYLSGMLDEYSRISKGLCRFSQKYIESVSEDALKQIGLIPRQIETQRTNQTVLQNIYSGLMLEFKGETKLIPFVEDVSSLEYDIANFILQVADDKAGNSYKRDVFVLAPEGSFENQYAYVRSWLEYAGLVPHLLKLPISELDPNIPLIVLGSDYVDFGSAVFIDIFLQKKGNAVFFVSGNNINVSTDWISKQKSKDNILDVLAKYGFYINCDLVLDLSNFRLKMNALDNSGVKNINYPFWINILYENLNQEIPVCAGIKNLQTFWPSSLTLDTDINPNLKPIASTTQQAILMVEKYDTDPFGKQLSLFAGKEKSAQFIAACSGGKSRIIVVSDENMISKAIEYTDSSSNLDFAVNCIEWITGKDRLLMLKNKTHKVLPFKYFENKDEFYNIIKRARLLNFVFLPIIILSMGFYVIMKTLKKKQVIID